ncbi:MAG TPA: penicillin-binding protein 1C [Thermodesulfovibrionales bacterium]|nr:penicillin-binding protein 1C [Thermodesulfovibrionales bacterium]
MKILFCLLVFLAFASTADALPAFRDVQDSYTKSDSVLLDRHGAIIHELRTDPTGRRLDWTRLEDISPALVRAVVLSEDKRFFSHKGVDWLALGSSIIKNIFTRQTRGASTLTMQLASILDESLKPKGGRRTPGQKWRQIKAAGELEESWSKEQILEAYLNLITFRGELQGVSASSRGLFDKEPAGLNEAESLILASLIRAPNAAVSAASIRACALAGSTDSAAGCQEIRRLAGIALGRNYLVRQKIALAPHVAHRLLAASVSPETGRLSHGPVGRSVVTTLDGNLQGFAYEVLRRHVLSVRQQNVRDGAVLVVENRTGDVLAYVGGIGDESSARYVDGIKARRQAGSTLKPFLYALALEKRLLTPASILIDSPADIPTALGIYKPEDYEHDFKGLVSVRTALASSLNIPAVRTLSLVGIDVFIQRLKLLGFSQLRNEDYYGFSVALGSADVSLWELVNAYRTMANKGVQGELRLTFGNNAAEGRRSFSESSAFLISDIISDREARSRTFSLENPLSTRFWSAVKTGTSKDMRDNWCIGYSDRYTVGVWVGNFSGAPMWSVSGVTGAAPVWLEIMDHLHSRNPGEAPTPPHGVFSKHIEFQDEIEPERTEWFIRDTEPVGGSSGKPDIAVVKADDFPHILYPSDGCVISIDPDIPAENQYIFFEAGTSRGDLHWTLNEENLHETSEPAIAWKLRQGKYALSLVDKQTNILDSVHFEVKGAPLKQPAD